LISGFRLLQKSLDQTGAKRKATAKSRSKTESNLQRKPA